MTATVDNTESIPVRRSMHRRVSSMDGTARQLTSAVIQEMVDQSEFFRNGAIVSPLPSFEPCEVQMGKLLGHGHFGEVFELTNMAKCGQNKEQEDGCSATQSPLHRIGLPSSSTVDGKEGVGDTGGSQAEPLKSNAITQQRPSTRQATWMGGNLIRQDGRYRYAIKRIFQNVQVDLHDDAIVDLTSEAMFLSRLSSHPNIITLHATVGIPGTSAFMLVLDRLDCNLQQKIQEWNEHRQRCRGKALGMWNRDKAGLQALYMEQLSAACGIAHALHFLHQHRILYRDIKPENIGVDETQKMRLFDFGLAKELKRHELVQAPDGYRATGVTGSRRYMAPEVCQSLPYGFSADVYSFGILLWEMLQLQTPFRGYDTNKHNELIVVAKHRPLLARSWSAQMKTLLSQCWAHSPLERCDMAQVCQSLEDQLRVCQG